MIICLYIETKGLADVVKLERKLGEVGYKFYNATDYDDLCTSDNLRDVEDHFEGENVDF